MSFQIFPNWCKKLGLVIFFIPFLFAFFSGFFDAFDKNENHLLITKVLGNYSIQIIEIIGLFGLLIYMLSKEKMEDDYIKFLRLESLQIAVIIVIVLSLLNFILRFSKADDINFSISALIVIYLGVFFYKKRTIS